MKVFLVRRLFSSIITVIGATIIVFGLSRAAGDPLLLYAKPGGYGVSPEQKAALERKLGLNKPLAFQYFVWFGQMIRGDLGRTLLDEKPVSRILAERVSATFQLGLYAWILATAVGVPLGVLSAVKRGTLWDYIGRSIALLGAALPSFWVAIVLILVFSVRLGWFPAATRGDAGWFGWSYVILPMVTLAWGSLAGYLRLTRGAMLEILDSEFIKLARSKGVTRQRVIWKHAFRNALIPPLTASVLILVGFFNGVVLIEFVFAWPGLGRAAVAAVNENDFPVIQAVVLFFTLAFVVMNFITDMLYAFIDPRIRYD